MPVRVRLVVAYDGAGFSGFALNRDVRTVAGVLASALETVLRAPVVLTCAGRTDAGVHAWGQVVSFDAPAEADLAGLARRVNALLAPEVVVREAAVADDGFDARRRATSRRYRYLVLNRPVPDPFLAATTWHVPEPLDLAAMRRACEPLLGEHDFSAFCRRPKVPGDRPAPSLVRRVTDAGWHPAGDDVLRFEIEASSFCHQMVRSIVGLLVAVGRGRRAAGAVPAIIESRDRAAVPDLAPAQGLTLWEVGYREAEAGGWRP